MQETKMTGLTADEVRIVAAELSQLREEIPTYNHDGSIAPHWAPVVSCEGAFFTLITPKVPSHVLRAILKALS
jgi:hypothetical protein